MSITIEELKDYIAHNVDEVTLLELLNISCEELVEVLHDKIDDNYEKLLKDLELQE
jgi:hypothetical protein